ncbi:MAG: cupin domain-containing protein [Oscillospiraceae bacterium]|nr:cupin domain-containing protein [Oscillospiraceae bacterium]
MENIFEKFNDGRLVIPNAEKNFSQLEWNKHPTFEGVELKHIVTASDTCGAFSYHLVRIAPNMKIGNHVHKEQTETHEVISGSGICTNEGKEISYSTGIISIMKMDTPHEVIAGGEGLYLFAKFIPALC